MNKCIWIINEYAGSAQYGMTYRHYYLAKEFIRNGYHTTIITASYSHFLRIFPEMKGNKYYLEKIDTVDYLWIDVIKYKKSFDKRRVLKWFQFMFKLFYADRYIKNKPGIIICSPTAPFSIIPAYYLARKYKAKLIFEVRDIWPLTLIEVGKISAKHPFIIFMALFERFALNRSDIIVSNLPNYGEYLQCLGIKKRFHWISNGVDLEELNDIEPLDLKIEHKIPKEKFIVGYAGTIGLANSIDIFLESIKYLELYKDIILVVVGDGQEKERLLQKYGHNKQIVFIPPIPKKQVQSLLKLFDVCYLGLKNIKIYNKYGVSANKLFDYMYSGRPVLQAFSGSIDIIQKAQCGISVEAENAEAIASGIIKLYNMPEDQRLAMGLNGKKYILENFTYEILANKYYKLFE